MGAIWGSVDIRSEKQPPYGITNVQERKRLNQMEPIHAPEESFLTASASLRGGSADPAERRKGEGQALSQTCSQVES